MVILGGLHRYWKWFYLVDEILEPLCLGIYHDPLISFILILKKFASRLKNLDIFPPERFCSYDYFPIHQVVEGNSKSGSNNISRNLDAEICVRLYGSYEW